MHMGIQYDSRGYLKPYDKIPIKLEKIEEYFVRPFPSSSTRMLLLEEFMAFADKLNKAIDRPLVIWIDGSFVTLKQNPNDIDLVVFIENEAIKSKYKTIREHFFDKKNLKERGLDVYYDRVFQKDHKDHSKYLSDYLYWYSWFTKTRKTKQYKRYPKGFLELNISS